MRDGPQLTLEQRQTLVHPLSEKEDALKGIRDLKAPGIDGFRAKNFKSSWKIIKVDVMRAVKEFFENGHIYKEVNCTIVTLIPKTNEAETIRDYMPIAGYLTLYKIILRILTSRLAKVIGCVISHS